MLPVIDLYGLLLQENQEYRLRDTWPAKGKCRHVIIAQDTFCATGIHAKTPVHIYRTPT